MTLQHLKVSFTPPGATSRPPRTYTYFNDDPEEVLPGDLVQVETRNGIAICHVIEAGPAEETPFPIKPCKKVG